MLISKIETCAAVMPLGAVEVTAIFKKEAFAIAPSFTAMAGLLGFNCGPEVCHYENRA